MAPAFLLKFVWGFDVGRKSFHCEPTGSPNGKHYPSGPLPAFSNRIWKLDDLRGVKQTGWGKPKQSVPPTQFVIYPEDYSSRLIASTGHSSTHAPHSVQSSASTLAVSSTVIASTGQTSAHAPHAVQVSSSIFAAISFPPFWKIQTNIQCRDTSRMSTQKLPLSV